MTAMISTIAVGFSLVLLSAGQAQAGINVIPEPSSFALLAAGAAAIAWAKFRRR